MYPDVSESVLSQPCVSSSAPFYFLWCKGLLKVPRQFEDLCASLLRSPSQYWQAPAHAQTRLSSRWWWWREFRWLLNDSASPFLPLNKPHVYLSFKRLRGRELLPLWNISIYDRTSPIPFPYLSCQSSAYHSEIELPPSHLTDQATLAAVSWSRALLHLSHALWCPVLSFPACHSVHFSPFNACY